MAAEIGDRAVERGMAKRWLEGHEPIVDARLVDELDVTGQGDATTSLELG